MGQQQKTQPKMNLDVNNFRDWFPKEHITAEDLSDGKGGYKAFTLTLERIEFPMVRQKTGPDKQKPVFYFKGVTKHLITNVTICKQMMDITGSGVPADWIGKQVELYVERNVKCPRTDDHPDGRADLPRLRRAKFNPAPNQGELAPEEPDVIEDLPPELLGDDD
jgi:hypothetical protein